MHVFPPSAHFHFPKCALSRRALAGKILATKSFVSPDKQFGSNDIRVTPTLSSVQNRAKNRLRFCRRKHTEINELRRYVFYAALETRPDVLPVAAAGHAGPSRKACVRGGA